jgi:6-pyruvoyltetrahydropterin/6-carboxytetrahydropterin synthase
VVEGEGGVTYSISKQFAFSASHRLDGLRDGHPCGRLHGLNYVIEVRLTGDVLNHHGFLHDYGDLAPFGKWLDDHLDHRHLNDVLDGQPSAENMARWLALVVADKVPLPDGVAVAVGVSETPKTWAWWTP